MGKFSFFRFVSHHLIFFATALLSAGLNTVLVRNLDKSSLATWVAAVSLTSAFGIAISGSTLRDLSQMNLIKTVPNPDNESKLLNPIWTKLSLLTLIISVAFSFILENYTIIYCVIVALLLYKNARISAVLQFEGKQSVLLHGTLLMYLFFMVGLVALKLLNMLTVSSVFIIHVFSYSLMLFTLKAKMESRIADRVRIPFTLHNLLFGLYYLASLLDLFIANIKLGAEDKYVYSGASGFSRFAFAVVSLYSLLFLSRIAAQARVNLRSTITYFSGVILFFGLLGVFLSILNSKLSSLVFGTEQLFLIKTLGYQLISLSPWLALFIPVQWIIVRNGKQLINSLLLVSFLELLAMSKFGNGINEILIIHFLGGVFLIFFLISSHLRNFFK